MLSALMRVFPPPTYMTMPCIGLDISDTSLKYVALAPSSKREGFRELRLWGDLDIPSAVLSRGAVDDPSKLVAVLKEFKDKTKAEFVRVSLPEERAYLFETEVKISTPLKEIRGLLEFRLEENVPIPSREVYFDYSLMPYKAGDRTVTVSVVAYAKQTIHSYYDACVAAGLRPISFEVEGQAMARAMVPRDARGASLIVDFGKTRTGIGIVYQGALLYTSTIDIGGLHLSQVLRKALGDKSEEELTHLKNTQGLVRGVDTSDVREALVPIVSVIRDEIMTRMQYWHSRSEKEDRQISTVILCGGSANLKGFPEYMTETLSVPTYRGNVWENVLSLEDSVPPIDKRHSYGYAAAIGLALKNIL